MAPSPADIATAVNPTGAASFTSSPKKKISSGTEIIPPPAPVRPIRSPTTTPKEGAINRWISIDLLYI